MVIKGKHYDIYIKVGDKFEHYTKAFNLFNSVGLYDELRDSQGPEKDLYRLAKAGDGPAADQLLTLRSNAGHEYETFSIADVL